MKLNDMSATLGERIGFIGNSLEKKYTTLPRRNVLLSLLLIHAPRGDARYLLMSFRNR